MKKLFCKIESMLDKKQVQIVKLDTEEKMLLSNGEFTPLEASEKALRTLFYKESSLFLSGKQIQTLKEYLEIHPVTDTTVYQTANRIYNDGNLYAYELERETGKCIVMTETEICIGKISHVFFRHSSDYKNQIEPEWKVDVQDIFPLVHKHFNLKNEKQEKLLILYLVTAFWGLRIAHPLLILTGEKGSSKSTTMRKLERLIDPKKSDLCGLPKGSDGLELRLSNTYFVTLDNLSNINRNVSDTIARAVTGGSVTKRALYHNTKEIVMDIKALVAMNGVSLIAKESDLLDRSLILELDRISSKEIKGEEELWEAFEKDRAKILGCIFLILSEALFDRKETTAKEKIRLADFHIACIKVGRVLHMTESEVSSLLWENQKNVNRQSIDEDIVACCLLELIDETQYQKKYNLITVRIEEVEISLQKLQCDGKEIEPVDVSAEIQKIQEYLDKACNLEEKQVSAELVEALVERITPTEEGVFKWYLKEENSDMEMQFQEEQYVLMDRFTLGFEEARAYRKSFGNFIRARQWKDLVVEVYIKKL